MHIFVKIIKFLCMEFDVNCNHFLWQYGASCTCYCILNVHGSYKCKEKVLECFNCSSILLAYVELEVSLIKYALQVDGNIQYYCNVSMLE